MNTLHTAAAMSFLSLTALLLFLGLFSATLAHESEEEDVTVVHMYDDRYEPQDLTIIAGDTIVFENESELQRWPASNIHPTHRAYPNSDISDCSTDRERFMFDACRGIKPGNTYTFQFNEVGEWRYHDHVAPDIRGTITVLAADSDMTTVTEPTVSWWRMALASFFSNVANWLTGTSSSVTTLETGLSDDSSPTTSKQSTPAFDETTELDSRAIATNPDLIYSHVKKFGAEATLAQLQSMEDEFGNCHDNAHYVGRYTYELFGSDAFGQCAMMCQSGCYHGAVEEFFRNAGTANLSESINALCKDQENPFIEHQCNHGVGHGLLAWANYQLFDALEGCDVLDDGTARESCYSGVFMENIVQSMAAFLGIEGHTTEYLSEDPHFPCTVVDDQYKPACYYLQTDRMITLANNDFTAVAKECSTVEHDHARNNCYQSLGRTAGGHNRHNPVGSNAVCQTIDDADNRSQCLSGAIQDVMWDKAEKEDALTFCSILDRENEKDLCYNLIINRANVVMDDQSERELFCSELESPYQPQCRDMII